MKIEYFQEFIILANKKNYMDAAAELYISQSTLSRHIMALEGYFHAQLFDRKSRRLQLTQAGEILLPYARNMVDEYYTFLGERTEENKEQYDSLFIAQNVDIFAAYSLLDVIEGFNREYSKVEIRQIDLVPTMEQCGKKYDLYIMLENCQQAEDGYERITLTTERLAVILSYRHKLSHASKINIEQLRDETFILPKENIMLRDLLQMACEKAGFTPKTAYMGFDGRNLVDMVNRGNGISIAMRKQYEYMHGNQLAIVDFEESPILYVNMIWDPRSKNKAVEKFIEYTRRFF